MAERPLTAKKVRGAYYTDPRVVEFLVAWGTSVAPGTVMDPSCGDGRFLEAAARHGAIAVIGCDIDGEALHQAGQPLMGARASVRFERSDFFSLEPSRFSGVDLVVGNPPFIRFQHFSGESRAKALRSALRVGGRLSRLTASWAPFLLHALQFLRVGGAMAMVVPAELAQTAYGVATLQALCANFGRVRLITFRRNWFEDAQQETFLLLASDRGGSCRSAELIPLGTIEELISGHALLPDSPQLEMAPDANMTIGLAFLDAEVRAIWATVCADDRVTSLAGLGDVANGYVSGANDFFHRTREQAHTSGIPVVWLVPAARSIRSLRGLDFAMADIEANESAGIAHHLVLPRSDDLFSADPRALDRFVAEGERLGLHRRYKCRSRSPWWQVPGLIAADVLLPYMIGKLPRSAVNSAHAVYSNSLHGIRLADSVDARRLVFGLLSSFSLLSMELEGRSYGGGVLKLEPSELQRVRVILPTMPESQLVRAFAEADRLLRVGDASAAVALADRTILRDQLGLSGQDISCLAEGREQLWARRAARGAGRNERP